MNDFHLERKVARLEHLVDHLYDRLDIAPPPTGQTALSPAVLDLLQQGNELEAIKQYRAETGLSLGEAKAAIDAARG